MEAGPRAVGKRPALWGGLLCVLGPYVAFFGVIKAAGTSPRGLEAFGVTLVLLLLLLLPPVGATVIAWRAFSGRFLALLIAMAWLIPFMGPLIVAVAPALPYEPSGRPSPQP